MGSRLNAFSAGLFVLASAAATFLAPARVLLAYDRGLVRGWEVWRVVTGHLVHADLTHLAVSAGLLALVTLAANHLKDRGFPLALLFVAAATGGGFAWLLPQSAGFSGLSAPAWGGAAYLASGVISCEGRNMKLSVLFLALILTKPVLELFTGSVFLTGAPDGPKYHGLAAAHMLGAVAGALAGYWAGKRRFNPGVCEDE